MSLAAALEIGKSGLKIYQVATEVVSENIANVNTPGYSRQRVVLETAPPSTANGFPLGTGVRIATVERYYDALLQKQLVNAETTSGFNSAKASVLQQIEPVFNEIAQDGLGSAISDFFNSWQDLTLNPTGAAERQAVLDRGQILTDQFHYVSSALSNASKIQEESIDPQVSDINQMIKNVSILNGYIRNTELSSGNANEMRDQRDFLIRQLSQQVGVGFEENADGQVDVYITDNSLPRPGTAGPDDPRFYVVKGTQYGSLTTTAAAPRDVSVKDYLGNSSNTMDPKSATPFFSQDTSGGKLWATLKMRDVVIPDYQQKVDELAYSIADATNTQQNAGFDLTNLLAPHAGDDFFSFTVAPTPPGGAATYIKLNLTATNQIAAASAAAVGPPFATGNGDNALSVAKLSKSNIMSAGASTFNGYYNGLVAQVGLDVQTANKVVGQDSAFMKQLVTLRDSNSGVSLDEELTDLIKYQRSYQASAKLITTAGEMMDTVINMIR